MGVRGLTGFIAKRAEFYLTPFELHDCNLVIDGDNLACNLYKDVTGAYSAFGGNYDDFYRAVVNFFAVLVECNINAYVLMDGGYEHRKLRTVAKRMRGKISVIKRINPCNSITVFPLMMKEVFVDAVKDCGIPIMRCVFEADDELAALSRKLNCPVLSYDSDFYIYNVKYIPLITLTVKAHQKISKNNTLVKGEEETRKLRRNEAKKLDKRTRGNRIMDTIVVDNKEKPKKGKSYKYLDCCLYRIENLIARGSLSKEKLPLFAAMLGNDYISRSSFKNFFQSGMGKVGRSRKTCRQQRRIKVILQWLKNETAESALKKIMSRLRLSQRKSLMAQIEAAVNGYSNEICRSYEYFKNTYENVFNEDFMETSDEETYDILQEEEESENEIEEEFEHKEEDSNESQEDGAEIGQELEEEEENWENESIENILLQNSSDHAQSHNSNNEVLGASESEQPPEDDKSDIISDFPQWFIDKLYPAHLPRFYVDLLHLKKYINNPQIEHFPFDESNGIALPILILIYSLINNVKGEKYMSKEVKDGNLRPLSFTYLTRCTRITNINYKHIEVVDKPKYDFDPETPNPEFLKTLFENNIPQLTSDEVFRELDRLPQDIRLYFMAIVYWLQKSKHCDIVHLHSLIVCLVVLRTIDSKIPAERDIKAFQKKFGKIIKKERQVRDKEEATNVKRMINEKVRLLPVPDRLAYIPKSDCLLVQNDLLKHFHMQEIFKKKYDLYSSIILHSFADFQSVVFQLHSLNALLDFPYSPPRMGKLYCGVFLYNLYDLLKSRLDIGYYIRNFIFRDSQMMFDFYTYLWDWCEKFLPLQKKANGQNINPSLNQKLFKKKRQQDKSISATLRNVGDPNADMLSSSGEVDEEFLDLNNKFCAFLKVR